MRKLFFILFLLPLISLGQEDIVLNIEVYSMDFNIESRYSYDFEDVIKIVDKNIDSKSFEKKLITNRGHINRVIGYMETITDNEKSNNITDLRLVLKVNYKSKTKYFGFGRFNMKLEDNIYIKNPEYLSFVLRYSNCLIRKSTK